MELCPALEGNSCSEPQEITNSLEKRHFIIMFVRARQWPHILSHLNPIHTFQSILTQIYYYFSNCASIFLVDSFLLLSPCVLNALPISSS
jgi:hypothetical protein